MSQTKTEASAPGEKVSQQEAAKYLGVHVNTIRNMIASGELNAWRIGSTRVIRVSTTDLEAILRPVIRSR